MQVTDVHWRAIVAALRPDAGHWRNSVTSIDSINRHATTKIIADTLRPLLRSDAFGI